jgi:hypothetical protein
MSFSVEFFMDPQGRLIARLDRDMAMGALKGGAIGAAKQKRAFEETANGLYQALAGAGVLVTSVVNP